MAITYPLSFPAHTGIRSITLRQVNVTGISTSPFTRKQQVISHAGQSWEADIRLLPMDNAQAKQWIAFLSSLKGHAGTFTMGDITGITARGEAGGTPLVNGASQTGSELAVKGATNSQTGWLKEGDYIQLGTGATASLHMVLTDADTDGAGLTTLDLWPDLRSSPSDGATITVASTVGLWRMNNNTFSWDVNQVAIFGMDFTVLGVIT